MVKLTENIQCPHCGSKQFITNPNCYDVYEIVNGRFDYIKSELIGEELRLYCRECGDLFDEAEIEKGK